MENNSSEKKIDNTQNISDAEDSNDFSVGLFVFLLILCFPIGLIYYVKSKK